MSLLCTPVRWIRVNKYLTHFNQCCGSGSVLDPYSGDSWIRIRIPNTDLDPDPHMQIYDKMEAKGVRFKIPINNSSETQLIKNFFMWQHVLAVLKKFTCFKENYFTLKLFWIFSFKIDSITLDPDPNWMYLDPQHCF